MTEQNTNTKIRPEWKSEKKLACSLCLLWKKEGRGNHLPWREHSDTILDQQHGHRIACAEREPLFKLFLPFLYCPKFWYLIRSDGARINLIHENTLSFQLQLLMSIGIQGPLKHKKHSIYNYSHKLWPNSVTELQHMLHLCN
jgi:hypothetical protein